MTREEHLEWCKKRALEYVDSGDLSQAYASMASDMKKHPDTARNPAVGLGVQLMFGGQLNTADKMRKFIEGFN